MQDKLAALIGYFGFRPPLTIIKHHVHQSWQNKSRYLQDDKNKRLFCVILIDFAPHLLKEKFSLETLMVKLVRNIP